MEEEFALVTEDGKKPINPALVRRTCMMRLCSIPLQ
jgi:hypothetical protein